MEEVKNRVQQYVRKARLNQAFNELNQVSSTQDEDWVHTLNLLEGRHNTLKRNEMMSILPQDKIQVERAQIVNGLLQLAGTLGEESAPQIKIQTGNGENRPANQQRKILFLAANPTNTGRIRLDVEFREISEGLRRSQHRDRFDLVTRQAVRPVDLQRAMLDEKPRIVHFSGHGVRQEGEEMGDNDLNTRLLDWGQNEDPRYIGGLALEDQNGNAHIIRAEALGGLFELFAGEVECVLLNACYSELQAEALKDHVKYIVGMNTAVPDTTAIAFATSFYDGLGAGRDIPFAFKLAKNAIQLQGLAGADIPVMVEGRTG